MPNQDAVTHRLAIVDGLRKYAYAIDDRDFDAVRRLFTPDAVLDYRASGGPRGDRDEVLAWIQAGLAQAGPTQHLVCNELVTFESATAVSRCYLLNPLLAPPGNGTEPLLLLGGEYRDRWRHSTRGWQIVERVHHVTWQRTLTG